MNILFTICGRAGSKGLKDKNLKKIKEIPLVYYTLAVIYLYHKAHPDDNIVVAVNTDSDELKKMIQSQNKIKNICFIERKPELAGSTVGKVAVVQDTYKACKNITKFDAVVDLDITSPMRRVIDVEGALKEFCQNGLYDIVYSVVPARRSPYFNMVEKKEKYFGKICDAPYTARQQVPQAYELNASIYVYSPHFLNTKIEKTILDYRCGIIKMEDYLVLDIDSEEDLELMQVLVDIFCAKDKELSRVFKVFQDS